MSQSSSGVKVYGGGMPTILGVTFIILKLCGVIQWEWVWVLAPFWIPLALAVVVMAVFAVVLVSCAVFSDGQTPRRRKW